MMSLRGAEDLNHARQQPLGAGTHVDGLHRQPDGVDANHRSSSRIQAAHCDAAAHGQLTVMAVVPLRSSMRIAAGSPSAGGNCTGTKVASASLFAGLVNAPAPSRSA